MSRFLSWVFVFIAVSCTANLKQNHLADQPSAFYQISAQDKIWWFPWSEEALHLAKKEKKLIYLTIGYTSCHACSSIQHQTHQDEKVVKLLNNNFVSIQLDREERPDLDAYFMAMQSKIMRFAAWPINMILSPDLKPVYATTALKPNKLVPILEKVVKSWNEEQDKVVKEIDTFLEKSQSTIEKGLPFAKDKSLIKNFYALYTHRFDTLYGGKSNNRRFAPKFPVNDEMRLLLRYHINTKEDQAKRMVEKTMMTMAKSPLFDQLGGGFFRYAARRDWNQPNHEKSVMTQAQFLHAYVDMFQFKSDEIYFSTIQKTVSYLLENMLSPKRLFYSGQSGTSKNKEGFYYSWKPHEIKEALNPQQQKLFYSHYQLGPILPSIDRRQSVKSIRGSTHKKLKNIERILVEKRAERDIPVIDKKTITASHAYVVSALSRIGQLAPSDEFTNKVRSLTESLLQYHRGFWGDLYHHSYKGRARGKANLDDFAYLVDALIEFYQLSYDEKFLYLARELQQQQIKKLYDKKSGFFRFNQSSMPFLKDQFLLRDQAHATGQSISYWNLIRLTRYFQDTNWQKMAGELLEAYPDSVKADPLSYSSLLLALDFAISRPKNLIILASTQQCRQFTSQSLGQFYPYVLFSCANRKSSLPLHQGKTWKDKQPRFFVCAGSSCEGPLDNFEDAKKIILQTEL